ncbi:family 43 glycosylhydrolase [bacterium]|nr:family 43 glycosylhydrolase [bacterium]
MLFTDTSRGRPFAKDPAVVRFGDGYFLYYSIPPFGDGRSGDGWAIGVAHSVDLETWSRVDEIRPVQECERNGICAPGAWVHGGKIHLFYQTYGNGRKDAICHAWSVDGIHFERDESNPVFQPSGDWNCGRAIDADVIEDGDRLLLYYATRDPDFRIQMLGVAAAPLTSSFGRADWTQIDNGPILKPELPWEQECIEAAALCRRNGRLFMFYAGAYNNKPQQIGCAVSDDGVSWQRLFDEPFLPNGAPGTWNASESGHPYVFVDADGSTHLFFQGNNDNGQSWYLSRVAVTWDGDRPRIGD